MKQSSPANSTAASPRYRGADSGQWKFEFQQFDCRWIAEGLGSHPRDGTQPRGDRIFVDPVAAWFPFCSLRFRFTRHTITGFLRRLGNGCPIPPLRSSHKLEE